MLEGLPDNKLDVVPNALGWRLGRSNSAMTKEAMELELDRACCGNEHGHFRAPSADVRHACGFKLANEFWESLARSGSETP
jgi:hypothetical protein